MKISTYWFRPDHVEAILLTDDNIYDVAPWCGGEVFSSLNKEFHSIKLPGKQYVHVGEYIVKYEDGTAQSFERRMFNKIFVEEK